MKKLLALVVLSCASLWAQTLTLHNGTKGSNQEFKPGPAGLIIENIDGTVDQIGKDLIGGTTVGKCITTVANLSSVCGTTTGQIATVTDATGSSDCTTGSSTNVALCIYNGSAWTAGSGGGSGTVTNIATTSPITGGAITTTGTIACATCTTAASALTANGLVKGAGSQAEAVSTVASDDGTTLTYSGTGGVLSTTSGGLKAGVNGSAAGVLSLLGATSGTYTMTANATATSITASGAIAAAGVTSSGAIGVTAANSSGFNVTSNTGAATGNLQHIQESITLSTGGTTTDSAANLLPANSLILGVTARVTTTITTATSWALGDASTGARFAAANSTMTAGTTEVGLAHWAGTVAIVQSAAAKLRITTVGTPGAGVIHVDVFYISFTAPTS